MAVAVAWGTLVASERAAAAVVADPTLASGFEAVDPPGSEEVDLLVVESGADTTPRRIEQRYSFAVLQDWDGFSGWNQVNGASNVLSFSDPTTPDVKFEVNNVSGSLAPNPFGSELPSANHATSGASAYELTAFTGDTTPFTGTHAVTMTFGTYDAGSDTFTDDVAVEAASFTLNNINGGVPATGLTRYRAEFFNAAGHSLYTSA
jgi:hypothetical protein